MFDHLCRSGTSFKMIPAGVSYVLSLSISSTHGFLALFLRLAVTPRRESSIASLLSPSFFVTHTQDPTARTITQTNITRRRMWEENVPQEFGTDSESNWLPLAWAVHSVLVESARSMGMLGHGFTLETVGNENPQREVIEVSNGRCERFSGSEDVWVHAFVVDFALRKSFLRLNV